MENFCEMRIPEGAWFGLRLQELNEGRRTADRKRERRRSSATQSAPIATCSRFSTSSVAFMAVIRRRTQVQSTLHISHIPGESILPLRLSMPQFIGEEMILMRLLSRSHLANLPKEGAPWHAKRRDHFVGAVGPRHGDPRPLGPAFVRASGSPSPGASGARQETVRQVQGAR